VHCVVARAREYYYYQPGRGTARQCERIRLPSDPRSPEFWNALRQAQGFIATACNGTFNALADGFLAFIETEAAQIGDGTRYQYKRAMTLARQAWGDLPAAGLRPSHVQAVMDGLADTPGKANNFLGGMRALSTWALVRDARKLIDMSLTQGVKPYAKDKGHKPWTVAQQQAALAKLSGVVRQGVVLYMYTGMRGSDAVRLGPTMIDDGGFDLTTQKRKRQVWCPIVPELRAEMATWDKRPGPFLLQEDGRAKGRPFTRKRFSVVFREAADQIPELAGVTLHGLRCTAVIRLRHAGLSAPQIGDIVGMSLAMVERYCRFADRKTSGQAALVSLAGRGARGTKRHAK
jgi:integrase